MCAKIKIMSFNIRVDNAGDGENEFVFRKNRILNFLNEEKPDVIGFQEISDNIRSWLVESLNDYYIIGVGRNSDYKGEGVPIAFRKDLFNLISCENIMLSDTPNVFGSRYEGTDQSPYPRLYARARLKHVDSDTPFYVYNVHTDHIGAKSRVLAVSQILEDVNSHSEKFFITGDFNSRPEDESIALITRNEKRKIKDTTSALGPTFHGFGLSPAPSKIDYIFADASIEILDAVKISDAPSKNETYISDHNPIYILANI